MNNFKIKNIINSGIKSVCKYFNYFSNKLINNNIDILKNPGIDEVRDYINLYPDDIKTQEKFLLKSFRGEIKNSLEIIKLILIESLFDPGSQNNRIIIFVSKYGYKDVVDLLLKDTRINPSDNFSIKKWTQKCC